ncbi:hypothetical protein DPMN_043574 [Dreissena polymorpha]|uniref:Uncharacterized protein n=1 Tax=Dreissena polymorpha TaxID=45954 RepID=A0A9D4D489_DREPO|nr:hypothetical protein DPMN_043574 [Dreissena polymorpha]
MLSCGYCTRESSPSSPLSDNASDTTCSGTTLSDNSMFNVMGNDSLVSVHSRIYDNLSISGVCEIEEEPRVSVRPNRPRMVETQTSPVSSPAFNTSRRNSFAGDSFIKIEDPPATGHTYRNIHLSELTDLIAEIIKDHNRPTGCRVISYIYNRIDSRLKNCRESLKRVNPQDKPPLNKIHSGTGDPPKLADPGCPPLASGPPSAKKKTSRPARTPAKLTVGHKLTTKSPHHRFNQIKGKIISFQNGQ